MYNLCMNNYGIGKSTGKPIKKLRKKAEKNEFCWLAEGKKKLRFPTVFIQKIEKKG